MSEPLIFEDVLEDELRCIEVLRQRRGVRPSTEDVGNEKEKCEPARNSADKDGAAKPNDDEDYTVTSRAHYQQLVGLAFSGGGIRSATFNLGILQSLAQTGLLRHFDYLSTVSGGGYIGSWLVAWIKRNSDAAAHKKKCARKKETASDTAKRQQRQRENPVASVPRVEDALAQEHCENPSKAGKSKKQEPDDTPKSGAPDDTPQSGEPDDTPQSAEPDDTTAPITPITFLRKYSNYLTPKTGFFSLDTWMAVATYIRNLVLNLNVLIFALTCALLLPRLFVATVLFATSGECAWGSNTDLILPVVIGLLGFLVAGSVAARFGTNRDLWILKAPGTFFTVVLPVFLIALLLVYWLIGAGPETMYWWLVGGGIAMLAFWTAFALLVWILHGKEGLKNIGFGANSPRYSLRAGLGGPAAAFVAGVVGGWLLWLLLDTDTNSPLQPINWLRVSVWAPPTVAFILIAAGVYFVGLMGRALPEQERQWWSRVGAFSAIVAAVWTALFMITFYAPVTLRWAASESQTAVASLGVGWLLSTAFGVIAGRSTATHGAESNRWLEMAVQLAPYVFVVGLVMLLALGIDTVLPKLPEFSGPVPPSVWIDPHISALDRFALDRETQFAWTAGWLGGHFAWLAIVWLAILVVTVLLSWRFDINEFSMHNFYRDRLTRAYLGASRNRKPNPFTGFDPEDDLDLTTLLDCNDCEDRNNGDDDKDDKDDKDRLHGKGYDGPYPIINATLNLTSGSSKKTNLAWQERKASSFVFTPRHHGFDSGRLETCAGSTGAYRKSADINAGNDPHKLSLGTAITVSGAAANPNMGFHSAPALSFLLTIFNARLGLWMGNPAHPTGCEKKSPTFSLVALLNELFGRTDAESKWVNLADGGFFDNLGVYELVRRRCRFIVACDSESDPKLEFNALGNVIRRCRSDFGIDIRFENLEPLNRRGDTPFSHWHCAVGTIRYDLVDERAPKGILVYIKSTLTGDEPADILNYQRKHTEFPHQSTADQWFDESQFESYRRLGEHIGGVVFGAAGLDPRK